MVRRSGKKERSTLQKAVIQRQKWKQEKVYIDGLRKAYARGKQEGVRRILPLPLTHPATQTAYEPVNNSKLKIHAIIAAKNEERTIKGVIDSAFEAGVNKVIVVANGCSDSTSKIAKDAGAKVIEYDEPLGYDVGRAIGLSHSPADVNVILDADFVLPPEDIRPYIAAVANGVDIALNDLNPLYVKYATLDSISLLKYNLNLVIGREDLGINALTAIPHALSRRAVNVLDAESLAVPPVALVKGVLANLNIQAVHTVDVFLPNKIRPEVHQFQGQDLVADLIVGDHLEALSYFLRHTDWRGGRTDLGRRRELTKCEQNPIRQWFRPGF